MLFEGAYRYYAPDNSFRYSFKYIGYVPPDDPVEPKEHKNPPAKGDKVVLIDHDDIEKFGYVVWVNRSDFEAGVHYGMNEYDSFSLDLFETNRGKARWRIYQ